MIKTVIFDLGKVIIPFDFKRGYQGLEQVCEYPAAERRREMLQPEDIVEAIYFAAHGPEASEQA